MVIPEKALGHPTDFKLSVRHELQHHRQKDTAWIWFAECLTAIFWWNPFTALWKKQIAELSELSCDEALMHGRRASPHDYGNCLVRVAEAAIERRALLAGTAGMALHSKLTRHSKTFLKRRIEMLFRYNHTRPSRVTSGAVPALLILPYASRRCIRSAAINQSH